MSQTEMPKEQLANELPMPIKKLANTNAPNSAEINVSMDIAPQRSLL